MRGEWMSNDVLPYWIKIKMIIICNLLHFYILLPTENKLTDATMLDLFCEAHIAFEFDSSTRLKVKKEWQKLVTDHGGIVSYVMTPKVDNNIVMQYTSYGVGYIKTLLFWTVIQVNLFHRSFWMLLNCPLINGKDIEDNIIYSILIVWAFSVSIENIHDY